MTIFGIEIKKKIMLGWSIPGIIVSVILGIAVYSIIASMVPKIMLSVTTFLASVIVLCGMGIVMSHEK